MTLSSLPGPILSLAFIASLLLLIMSIHIAVEWKDIKMRSPFFLYSLFFLFASFLPAQVLAEIGSGHMFLGRLFLHFPVYSLVLYLLAILSLEIFFMQTIRQIRKRQIGKNSIKESLDNLPDGLCFSKLDGTPLLVNRIMQEISYQVFGQWLVNDVVCAEAIKKKKIEPQADILQRHPLVIQANRKIWLIQLAHHDTVKETVAYDITPEWGLLREIKRKNEEIQKVNSRLKKYQQNVREYTRQKEILQAKITIHDKIGQSLIYFKHYLGKSNKSMEDRKKVIRLWQESLLVLDETKNPPSTNSSWEKLLTTARAIGVDIHVQGTLPEDEKDLSTFVGIVHEALNNAIRHGKAKNVWITLEADDRREYCRIINDGKPAIEPIHERGGLKNIRERIQLYDGEMTITTSPHFQLNLSWPKGATNEV